MGNSNNNNNNINELGLSGVKVPRVSAFQCTRLFAEERAETVILLSLALTTAKFPRLAHNVLNVFSHGKNVLGNHNNNSRNGGEDEEMRDQEESDDMMVDVMGKAGVLSNARLSALYGWARAHTAGLLNDAKKRNKWLQKAQESLETHFPDRHLQVHALNAHARVK